MGEERRLRLMRVSGTKVEVVRIVGDRQPGWFLRMVEGGEKVGVLFWWEAEAQAGVCVVALWGTRGWPLNSTSPFFHRFFWPSGKFSERFLFVRFFRF